MRTIARAVDIKKIDTQTEENCFYAILKSHGEYIKYVLSPSDNLIKLALRINGNNIRFLPNDLITEELCELAAIHGANINSIPYKTDNVKSICDIVSYHTLLYEDTKKKKYNNYRLAYEKQEDITINNERTNYEHSSKPALFEDIPEYVGYYTSWGYKMPSSRTGKLFVVDGKIYSNNSLFDNWEEIEKFEFKDTIEDCYNGGIFNRDKAQNIISKDPAAIFKLKEEDISATLIGVSVSSGLSIDKYKDLAKYNVDAVSRAAIKLAASKVKHDYASSEGARDLIEEVYKINDNNLSDDMLKLYLSSANGYYTHFEYGFGPSCLSIDSFDTLVSRINRIIAEINKGRKYGKLSFDERHLAESLINQAPDEKTKMEWTINLFLYESFCSELCRGTLAKNASDEMLLALIEDAEKKIDLNNLHQLVSFQSSLLALPKDRLQFFYNNVKKNKCIKLLKFLRVPRYKNIVASLG